MTESPIARRDQLRARGAVDVGRLWTGDRAPSADVFGPLNTTTASVRASNGEGTIAPSFVGLDEAGGFVLCDGIDIGPLSERNSLVVDSDGLTAVYSPEQTLGDATERVLPAGADSTIGVGL